MNPAARFKLINDRFGLFLLDTHSGEIECLVCHPVIDVSEVWISGVLHYVGDDGESLFPVHAAPTTA